MLVLVLVEEEVKEEGGSKEGRLHLRQAVGGEVNDEVVTVGEQLLAHVGGGLRDGPHLLPLHVADDKVGLGKDRNVNMENTWLDDTWVQQHVVRTQGT